MQGCNRRDTQLVEQRENVAAVLASEKAVFVLNKANIGPAMVDEFRCLQIRFLIVLVDDKPYLWWIFIHVSRVVDGHNETSVSAGASGT